jgi:hypothetical protein
LFRRQLSQLSDGPITISKWLAIHELQLSETRLVAESAFLADHTFLYKSDFWQNFNMPSLETSYIKNVTNKLKCLMTAHTTCFDIWFGRYGILMSGSSSGQVMDRLDIQVLIRFLGHKEGGTCWGLNTKSGGNQLSFLTPTQKHVFNNRSNSYSH